MLYGIFPILAGGMLLSWGMYRWRRRPLAVFLAAPENPNLKRLHK